MIRLKYNGVEGITNFAGTKYVEFHPYTIYYIKSPVEGKLDYKCVVMMSGIDPDTTSREEYK